MELKIQSGGCTSPEPNPPEELPDLGDTEGKEISIEQIAAAAAVGSIVSILSQGVGFAPGAFFGGLFGASVGAGVFHVEGKTLPGLVGFLAMIASGASLITTVARVVLGR